MYCYKTGIGQVDQVFSGDKAETVIIILIHKCRGLYRIHGFHG